MIKKILQILGLVLVLALALMILVPYLYQDEIKQRIKENVDALSDANIDFEDVSLSIISNFPNLTLSVKNLVITNAEELTDTIIATKQADVGLDFWNIVKNESSLRILSFNLQEPFVRVVTNQDGTSNYDVLLSSNSEESNEESVEVNLDIEEYKIIDGRLTYIDASSDMAIQINHLDHKGSGNYSKDILNMDTETAIKSITVNSGGTRYLNKAKLDANVDLSIDLATNTYTLKENDIKINDLQIISAGSVIVLDDGFDLNLDFSSPQTAFKSLWSIIPAAYTKDYNELKADGTFSLKGSTKGKYNSSTGSLPGINVHVNVVNGKVQYPSLPKAMQNIQANLTFTKSAGKNTGSITDVEKLDFNIGQSFFKSQMDIDQSAKDLKIDGFVIADMELEDLAAAMPMEGTYAGNIKSDVKFSGSQKDVEAENYNNLKVEGVVDIKNTKIKITDYPSIVIDDMDLTFTPQEAKSSKINAKFGESDVSGSAVLKNPMALFIPSGEPMLNMNLKSNNLNTNEWLNAGAQNGVSEQPTENISTSILPYGLVADVKADVKNFQFEDYVAKNITGDLKIQKEAVQIRNGHATYNGQDLNVELDLQNIPQYLSNTGSVKGDINVQAKEFNLDKFMSDGATESTTGSTNDENFVVPANMDLNINSDIDKVQYGKMDLNNLKGKMSVKDQVVNLEDVTTNMLDGTMKLIGTYASNGKEKPQFNLKYDVLKMPFNGVVDKIASISLLAPIMKYIDGIFNSTLVVKGGLNKGMMPDLASLTASGYIETLNGQLGKLPFIGELANKLAVDDLKKFSLENTKNWFDIENGTISMKPFDYNFEDIQMKIEGSSTLDQSIQFNIIADIPKEKFSTLPGAQALDKGLGWVNDEASKLGFSLGEIKSYKMGIDIGGTITKPTFKIKLLDATKGAVKNKIDEGKEILKEKVRDTLTKEANKVITKAQKEVDKKVDKVTDSIQKRVDKEVDKAVDKAKEKIGSKAGEVVDSTLTKVIGDKAGDVLGDKSKEEVDKVKDALKEWNPFKKKK